MATPPQRPLSGAFVGELQSLIAAQKRRYIEYLRVLGGEKDAVENDDEDRLDLYRHLEVDGREKIIQTDRSLQALFQALPQARVGAEQETELAAGRGDLESLRLSALAAIDATRKTLESKKEAVKKELAALSATRSRLAGGNRPSGDDPLFIDTYS
ncbi:MAG: hypothetical protein JXD23_16775 [Spirochaetales bacterium]|nr:hypothetical protein [Spirochaetales bacterium]